MKRFAWRLQKVLDIKTKEEQLKRMELFRLTETLAIKRGELLMRRRILQEIADKITRDRSAGRLSDQEFFLRNADIDDRLIQQLSGEIEQMETQRSHKTAEVLALRQFKEGLQKLRTEAEIQFIEKQEKLEQKEMDDRTTIAFARNEGMRL